MGSLERRVRKLEPGGRFSLAPSRTQLEAWAIDAEIRAIDEELELLSEVPLDDETRTLFESLDGLSLDEKIAALELEIEREGEA